MSFNLSVQPVTINTSAGNFTGHVPAECVDAVAQSIEWMRNKPLGTYDAPFFQVFFILLLFTYAEMLFYFLKKDIYLKHLSSIVAFKSLFFLLALVFLFFIYY